MKKITELYDSEYIRDHHLRGYVPERLSLSDEKAFAFGFKDGVNAVIEQLQKAQEENIERFNRYYDKKLNHNVQEKALGAIFIVDELPGTDSRDKLHCGFCSNGLIVITNRREELTEASVNQCGELVGMYGEITMTHVLKAFKMGAKWADEHPCPESRVKFSFMGTELTMTIQQLIDYFIEQECIEVAEECNF